MPLKLENSIFFQALMGSTFDEIFIIDSASMQLVAVSQSVCLNFGLDLNALQLMAFEDLLNLSQELLKQYMQIAKHPVKENEQLNSSFIYLDEAKLKVMHLKNAEDDYLVVIKNDIASKNVIERALSESEMRFQAIIANTPSLVCQFRIDSDCDIQFDYLSDHCQELLGFTANQLKLNSKLFFEMMHPRDRSLFWMRMKLSLAELSLFNWDGRVWIADWQDTKWINMRSTPRKLRNGQVQWGGFITNITQSMDEKFEIEESRRRLSELTAHMNHIKEDERQKIACEIHDDLGGNLTAVKIGLSSLIQKINRGQNIEIEKLLHLDEIVDETYEAIHRISSDLRPNILELGIIEALGWQCTEFEKQYNIPCQFKANNVAIELRPEQEMALFRICQEAMSNIAKYAQASEVIVHLNLLADEIELVVVDNGIGIKPIDKIKDNSFGLRGMQERAYALSGQFKISRLRAGKQGTQVNVRLPL